MSVPFGSAVLTLDDITRQIRRTFAQFTDPRRGKNTRYTLVDAGLSPVGWAELAKPNILILLGNASLMPNLHPRFPFRH